MQGKRYQVENFPPEERKQSKNHCSPVKLESKKKRLKKTLPGKGSGWEATSDRRGKATSRLVLGYLVFYVKFLKQKMSFGT